MNRLVILNVFLLLISIFPVYSQESSNETQNTQYAVSLFTKASARQSRLNNGREYIHPAPHILGHPFFETNVWTPGRVVYDGVAFDSVDMRYDLSKDELVVLNFALLNKLSLVKQKVQEFTILDHKFIYLELDTQRRISQAGFYDQLYHQTVSVLVKRKKIVGRNITMDPSFVGENQYYLVKANMLHRVKSKASVLNLLKDKKTELQQYLRKNDIDFRADPERAIVLMATHYDQLIN